MPVTEEKNFNPLEEAEKEFNLENGIESKNEPEKNQDVDETEDTDSKPDDSTEESTEPSEEDEKDKDTKTELDDKSNDGDGKQVKTVSEDDRVVEDFDKYAAEIAEKENLSVEEAREIVRKELNISNNFKSKIELARAYRRLQQVKSELENKIKENNSSFAGTPYVPEGHISVAGKLYTKAEVVDWYRGQDDDRAELSDEYCFKEACKEIKARVKKQLDYADEKNKNDALVKRTEILKNIPKEQSRFLPEIKYILGRVKDSVILSDSFQVDDVVTMAKGKMYDIDIAQAKKSAVSMKKLVESKSPAGSGSSGNGKKKSILTEEQKLDAAGRFPGISQEEANELYIESGLYELK